MAAVNGCSPFQMLDRTPPYRSILEWIISIHFILAASLFLENFPVTYKQVTKLMLDVDTGSIFI